MKKKIIILIASLFSVLTVMSEKYTIEFSADEFRFETENSCMSVLPVDNFKYFYLEGDSFPCLPMHVVSVLLEPDQIVANYSFTELSQSVVYNNVTLATAPTPIPTSQIGNTPYTGPKPYLGASFPAEVLKYSDMGEYRGNRIAYFAVSPFKYDATTKKVSLVTKIELTVTTTFKANEMPYHPMDNVMLKSLINPELNDRIIERHNAKEAQAQDKSSVVSVDYLDYLIVTNETLKPAFESLKAWKNKKGVKTEIVTVNQIIAGNSTDPLYLAIKKYIRDYYVNRNIKYVLLGGDQTVIPAVYCKAPISDHSPTIPADMFYATFEKAFNWDSNNNNILGEMNDNIDLTPEVYLSRISVNNLTNANNVVLKIIKYETNPNLEYINKLLLSGVQLKSGPEGITSDGRSDAEVKSEIIYKDSIQPYWSGVKYRLYDTNTDFGDPTGDIDQGLLSNVLNQGYHFMHMMTHGGKSFWSLGNNKRFNFENALDLQNSGKCINVVSNSCMINWFDNDLICLTEALMNNPDGGAISIFASSREGWYVPSLENIFCSNVYNATFFKYLFKEQLCQFANLTTNVKLSFAGSAKTNSTNRWLQYSINPMGDPEMPIYTDVPQNFNNIRISSGSNATTIYTGVPGCTIAVTDCNVVYSGNCYQVFSNTDCAVLYNLPKSFDIVITKHNYIPYQQHIDIDCSFIQKETITTTKTVSNSVEIGYDVTNLLPKGDVVVKNNGKLKVGNADYVLIKNGFTVELGGELEVKP